MHIQNNSSNMAGINLIQSVADALLAVAKYRIDETEWRFPYTGGKTIIPLKSLDGRESFHLDLYRGRINLAKNTFQNRARRSVILARLDIDGPPHRNPDGIESGWHRGPTAAPAHLY